MTRIRLFLTPVVPSGGRGRTFWESLVLSPSSAFIENERADAAERRRPHRDWDTPAAAWILVGENES